MLVLVLLALALPYFGFVVYYGSQFKGPAPVWFTNTIAFWFAANFCIAVFLGKRILKGQVVDAEAAREAENQSADVATRLIAIWAVLFLAVLVGAIQGKIALNRAIPAGMLLMFFISFFGWSAYRGKRSQR